MRLIAALSAVAFFSLQALPAEADWNVKVKLSCSESDPTGTRLEKLTGSNDDLIAACLGIPPEDPAVADYVVLYGEVYGEGLTVRFACDPEPIVCDLSDVVGCQSVVSETPTSISYRRSCVEEFEDFFENDVFGTMLCSESSSYNPQSAKLKYGASCKGNFVSNGLPCEISFKTAKEHVPPASCPE